MRVTNSMLVNNFKNNLNTNLVKLDKLQGQLATNRKVAHVSDDPIATIYSQQANYKIARLAQYQRNVEQALDWTLQTETGMMELNEILKKVYEASIDASTDVKTKSDMINAAQFVKQMRDQIIHTLNTAYGDKYVFGGYNTVGYYNSENSKLYPPFSADEDTGELLFNGIPVDSIKDNADPEIAKLYEDVISFIVGPGIELPVNYNGLQLVMFNERMVMSDVAGGDYTKAALGGADYGFVAAAVPGTGDYRLETIEISQTIPGTRHIERKEVQVYVFDPGNGDFDLDTTVLPGEGGYALDSATGLYFAVPANGEIFVDTPGTGDSGFVSQSQNIYELVNDFYNSMIAPDTTAIHLTEFIKPLQDAQTYVLARVAEIGGRTNRLEMLMSRYEQDEIAYHQMKSDAEDADQAEVIMNYKMAEAVYRAALSTGAYIIQPTLMDFLR